MELPKHIAASIEHNPHAVYYQSIRDYIAELGLDPSFADEAEEAGELWEVSWYPNTPVSYHVVVGPSLDITLGRAGTVEV